MTATEIMRAFDRWQATDRRHTLGVYPLYVGYTASMGTWYVREYLPSTRIWRAEEDGSFTLIECTFGSPDVSRRAQ